MLDYGDTEISEEVGSLLLHEARTCEILKMHPHPNVAKCYGCRVENGRIAGLCFAQYGADLWKMIQRHEPVNVSACLMSIEMGIKHLHSLGIIHCDVNPSNVFLDGDSFVLGDFDSCAMEGAELGLKAGTEGWTCEEFTTAVREMDFHGLMKIREALHASLSEK